MQIKNDKNNCAGSKDPAFLFERYRASAFILRCAIDVLRFDYLRVTARTASFKVRLSCAHAGVFRMQVFPVSTLMQSRPYDDLVKSAH